MRIGIGIPNQVRNMDPKVVVPWATRAERAGFATLGTIGRIAYPGMQDTVALAAAAGATSKIGLFSNVLIGPAWSPVLLAKEVAGINGVSGGRLTLGLGLGARPDDYTVEGRGPKGLGGIIDSDLEVYRDVWNGAPVGGGTNPAVPHGTRPVPLMFGGVAPSALARMAKWGEGYIGASVPAAMVADAFDNARAAWQEAGRDGSPRLVAICYFALGDGAAGRANAGDYYSVSPGFAELVTANVAVSAADVVRLRESFEAIGTDELIFNPTTDDVDDVERLAEVVL